MSTVVLVPRRAGIRDRDTIWRFLRPRWEALGFPVSEGHDDGPLPFNRAAASNRAAAKAGDWDTAILIDSDVWAEAWQINAAIAAAATTGRLTFPHTGWWGLSRLGTQQVLRGRIPFDPASWGRAYQTKEELSHSAAMVIPRQLWDAVGGIDERFVGWGAEDWMWHAALWTLGGGDQRINAPVYHFHHETSQESKAAARGRETPVLAKNHALGRRYLAAKGKPDDMRALLAEARQHRQGGVVDHGPEPVPAGVTVRRLR